MVAAGFSHSVLLSCSERRVFCCGLGALGERSARQKKGEHVLVEVELPVEARGRVERIAGETLPSKTFAKTPSLSPESYANALLSYKASLSVSLSCARALSLSLLLFFSLTHTLSLSFSLSLSLSLPLSLSLSHSLTKTSEVGASFATPRLVWTSAVSHLLAFFCLFIFQLVPRFRLL